MTVYGVERQKALLGRPFAMRMRGLEPPPDFSDTDLNRTGPEYMGPPTSSMPGLWGFVSLTDACGDAFVATLLPRDGHRGPVGVGTPSCRQMPRAVGGLISR